MRSLKPDLGREDDDRLLDCAPRDFLALTEELVRRDLPVARDAKDGSVRCDGRYEQVKVGIVLIALCVPRGASILRVSQWYRL